MKMKVLLGFYLWVMLVVVVTGTAFMLPAFSTISTSSSTPDMNSPMMGSRMKGARSIRKLELGSYKPSTEQRKSNPGNLNLEDYHPIDPSPSSRAAITSGPIEHGTPIIPYIPNVPPPCPPKQDGGSSPPV